jgi:CRP-like cAMP-binding protein
VTKDTIRDFFANYESADYVKGDIIIFARMNLESVFYLESGSVIEYDINSKGVRTILNTFKTGAYFPMSNAVNHIDTDYFFEANEKVRVIKAPAADVVEFIKSNPDIMLDLLQRVFRGADGLLARQVAMMQGDAGIRVMQELNIIAARFGSEPFEGGDLLTKRVSEVDLSERSGLARETISRAIQKLKKNGQLKTHAGRFIIYK